MGFKFNAKFFSTIILSIIILTVLLQSTSTIMVTQMKDAGDAFTDYKRCAEAGGILQTKVINGTQYIDTCFDTINVNNTVEYKKIPLGNLFSSSGGIFIIIMAGILIFITKMLVDPIKK